MSKFGWSYPAGCDGPPDNGNRPSELVETIGALLEDAGIDTETNDAIFALVEAAEARLAERATREYWQQPSLQGLRDPDDVRLTAHPSAVLAQTPDGEEK
jgi:hypothetical protein